MNKFVIAFGFILVLVLIAWLGVPYNVYEPLLLGLIPRTVWMWGAIFILEIFTFWLVAYKWDIYNINNDDKEVK